MAKKGGKKPLTQIANKMSKGGLHRSLGIPEGEKIPASRIAAAAAKGGKIGKQARLAQTFAKFRKGGKRPASGVRKVRSY